jgi:hypothetical protein
VPFVVASVVPAELNHRDVAPNDAPNRLELSSTVVPEYEELANTVNRASRLVLASRPVKK